MVVSIPVVVGQYVPPRVDRHDDLLQRRIACPLADTVDCALDLPRTGLHSGQRIGDGHAKIVVAMNRKDSLVSVRHPIAEHIEQGKILLRHGVTDRIGDIDGRRTGIDRRLDAGTQEIVVSARAVFRRPFDVLDEIARLGDRPRDHLQDFRRLLLELPFHVHRRGGNEGVDAWLDGMGDGRPCPLDIAGSGTGEPGNGRVLHTAGDFGDGLEIAVRGDGETGFDNIDTHFIEAFSNLELFLERHRGAGALLAVAQGRVKNQDALTFARSVSGFIRLRCHRFGSFGTLCGAGTRHFS